MSTNCWVRKTRMIDLYESRPALVLGLFIMLLMITYDCQVLKSFLLDGRSTVVVFSENSGNYLICQGTSCAECFAA
ncbi:hypothetical protein BV898_00772 [Hypsibius exemplaris]|uniref:Uncharacterized protein n=1 Tax=Hypsibius exemplaris TaxID=2072580 RepID=A0A1W0XEF9_HYPEX|nr:hypothetical protein BV898_00772 [Hypsibius exemplaris]